MHPHHVWLVATVLAAAVSAPAAPPALTIYNQDFGVVREHIPLDLAAGENEISFSNITAHVEPDSVILRDPTGLRTLQILEQNYRGDPLSQDLLLSRFEGETIQFQTSENKIVSGRIVRSGYVPHYQAWQTYGWQYMQRQSAYFNPYGGGGGGTPIIAIDGELRFGLPGTPLFPALGDDTILRPTLHWTLVTDQAGALTAELSYITGGMRWRADYNVVAPEEGEALDLMGWVTIDNQTGRDFEQAQVKLMAGDVSRLTPAVAGFARNEILRSSGVGGGMQPAVTERRFDEYHLYTIERPTTLRDRQTKQVEFTRAAGVPSKKLYVYDGVAIDWSRYQGWDPYSLRTQAEFGTDSNDDVWVMREFENREEAGLGIPLPAGRMRFYRRDQDGQLEFIGENEIDHTPKDETIRVYTGNAFDLVGERRRSEFKIEHAKYIDETFEISLRNHTDEAVTIHVVEHLYRWNNWEIQDASDDYEKKDSHTIEFALAVEPNAERKVSYKVHYTW